MGVTVDLKGLLPQWRDNWEDSMLLVFQPDASASEDDVVLQAVNGALRVANEAAAERWQGPSGTSISGWDAWLGPRGPVIFTPIADSAEAIQGWLGVLAGELGREGWRGRLGPERGQAPDILRVPKPVLTAVVCVEGWRLGDRGRATSPWQHDHDLRRRLVGWAVGWVALTDDALYISQGAGTFRMSPAAVERGLLRQADKSQLIWSPDASRMRSITFTRAGRLFVQLHDSHTGWRENLQELRQVIVDHARASELAFIRHSWSNPLSTDQVVDVWPPKLPRSPALDVPRDYYRFRRHLDHERVPDASGLQLLTDAHLTKAHDLSRWNVTSMGDGRHLVEARDLEAWFAHDQPDSDVLAEARGDFGNMILWKNPPLGES